MFDPYEIEAKYMREEMKYPESQYAYVQLSAGCSRQETAPEDEETPPMCKDGG
jgi:hypothetical protein